MKSIFSLYITRVPRVKFRSSGLLGKGLYPLPLPVPQAPKWLLFVFESGFNCIVLAGPELTMWTTLSPNSQGSTCFWLQSAGIKGTHYYTWSQVLFKKMPLHILFKTTSLETVVYA